VIGIEAYKTNKMKMIESFQNQSPFSNAEEAREQSLVTPSLFPSKRKAEMEK